MAKTAKIYRPKIPSLEVFLVFLAAVEVFLFVVLLAAGLFVTDFLAEDLEEVDFLPTDFLAGERFTLAFLVEEDLEEDDFFATDFLAGERFTLAFFVEVLLLVFFFATITYPNSWFECTSQSIIFFNFSVNIFYKKIKNIFSVHHDNHAKSM